jgi:hypothetical protein
VRNELSRLHADNEAGWRSSLAKLAALVEAEAPAR